MNTKRLNLQFAGLQGMYWMSYCIVYSFAAAFLLYNGFSNTQIGYTLAIANILAVLIQPIIALIVDKSQKITSRTVILVLGSMAILTAFSIWTFVTPLKTLFFLFVSDLVLLLLIEPHLSSLPFSYINQGVPLNYGFMRSMGSLFYGSTSFILSKVIDVFSPGILIPIQIFVLFILGIFTLTIKPLPKKEKLEKDEEASSWPKFALEHKRFMLFALGVLCLFTASSSQSSYMLQIVLNVGGSETAFGSILGFAAFVEIPTMLLFSKVVRKFKIDKIVKMSAIFISIRMLGTFLAGSTLQLLLVQLIQALGYAVYIVAAPYYVNLIIGNGDKVKGQTLLTMASTSGGVIGSGFGGVLIDLLGVKEMLFIMVVISALGATIIFFATENIYSEKMNILDIFRYIKRKVKRKIL